MFEILQYLLNQIITYIEVTIVPWIKTNGILIVIVVFVTFIILKVLNRLRDRYILNYIQKSKLKGFYETKRAETLAKTIANTIKVLIIMTSVIVILGLIGVNTTALIASTGFMAAALGFGAQSLVKDVIAGIFILAENQYRVGDYVTIANIYGKVEEITLRITVIRGQDGVKHYIPNGQILYSSNFSKSKSGIYFDITISSESDFNKAIKIINETGVLLSQDAEYKDLIIKPPHFAHLEKSTIEGTVLSILGEAKTNKQWFVSSEFRRRIFEEFKKNNIKLGEDYISMVKGYDQFRLRYN